MPPSHFHKLTLRAFAHQTERPEVVKAAMLFLASPDESLPMSINETITEGYHGNRITVLDIEIKKQRVLKDFFRHVVEANGKGAILSRLEEVIDEDCQLHLRFDKDRVVMSMQHMERGDNDGLSMAYKLSTGDNVIKAILKVRAYPAKKSAAVEALRALIKGFGEG